VWRKCEKPKSGKNVKNSRGNFLEKNVEKIGVEKTWINDLEQVKSVKNVSVEKSVTNFRVKILHI
jgi:hypothetical protein